MSSAQYKTEVGELRPSQVILTFGVGAVVDLPNLSVMVMGLDDWPTDYGEEIGEERLLRSVQESLGAQVSRLRTPPRVEDEGGNFPSNPFDERAYVGVPVAPFPRWMVCPSCQLLAPLSSGLFQLRTEPYRSDRTRFLHTGCPRAKKPPAVLPARFVVACPHGHLDDFPWVRFVHRGETNCRYRLRLYELGVSGEAADVQVECEVCGQSRRMAEAFGRENQKNLPACRARRPHLRNFDDNGCDVEHVTAMLQGASNSWFPVMLSALSIPSNADPLAQLVEDNWHILEKVKGEEFVEFSLETGHLKGFGKHTAAEIWQSVQKKRSAADVEDGEPTDLKTPEWKVFSNPGAVKATRDFKLRAVAAPEGYEAVFDKIVLAESLREVRALIGFTRIESPGDYETPSQMPEENLADLSRTRPKWVPANEIRGEGLFFQFDEDLIERWCRQAAGHDQEFYEAHKRWREIRKLPPDSGYPEIRYVLLHSFAHALLRQLSIECGYTTASIRERIYCQSPAEGEPMAGVLLYTAAPDSEGTLGGLVSLGEPDTLGRHLDQALEAMRLCASDPLCAEHHPYREGVTLHAAACHACLFLPETSCERGNKYLDRSVLVSTVERSDLAFFDQQLAEATRKSSSKGTKAKPAAPVPAVNFDEETARQAIRDFLADHPGSTTAQVLGELNRHFGMDHPWREAEPLAALLRRVAREHRETGDGQAQDVGLWYADVTAPAGDGRSGPDDLDELLELCHESCRPLLRAVAEAGATLPEIGYELADATGRVSAEAELAWPSRRLAVLLDGEGTEEFTRQGWTVRTLPKTPDDVLALLKNER